MYSVSFIPLSQSATDDEQSTAFNNLYGAQEFHTETVAVQKQLI